MKKVISFLIVGLLFLKGSLPLGPLTTTLAAQPPSCGDKIVTQPDPVTTNDRFIGITINYNGLSNSNKYYVYIDGNPARTWAGVTNQDYQPTNGSIHIDQINHSGLIPSAGVDDSKFEAKNYSIAVKKAGIRANQADPVCTGIFTVQATSVNSQVSNGCKISFKNQGFTANDEVIFQASPLDQYNSLLHHWELKKDNINGSIIKQNSDTTGHIQDGISLGNLEKSDYYLEVRTSAGTVGEEKACATTFKIVGQGETGGGDTGDQTQGGAGSGFVPTVPPPTPPCAQNGYDKQGRCTKVTTALGDFSTDPIGFIDNVFRIFLGLAGGIALLIIIQSGYKIMTSQGNPQAIQGARETLTSAIVGLLFVIFSLVILQIIGVDILHIPGLGSGLLPGAGSTGGPR